VSRIGKDETRDSARSPGGGGRRAVVVPEVVWTPVAVGGLLLATGLIGLLAGQPWLFPSLGPTAFLQAEEPGKPASRFYNTVVGHLVGLVAGVLAAWLFVDAGTPPVLATKDLVPARVWAAALSGVLTMLGLALLKAQHPPAAATMLLVALGGIAPTWRGAGMVVAGVLIVASLGEGVRYLRREVFIAPEAFPGPQ
jgi:hypothetical protein